MSADRRRRAGRPPGAGHFVARDFATELPADLRAGLARLEWGRTDDDVTVEQWNRDAAALAAQAATLSAEGRRAFSAAVTDLMAAELGMPHLRCLGWWTA